MFDIPVPDLKPGTGYHLDVFAVHGTSGRLTPVTSLEASTSAAVAPAAAPPSPVGWIIAGVVAGVLIVAVMSAVPTRSCCPRVQGFEDLQSPEAKAADSAPAMPAVESTAASRV